MVKRSKYEAACDWENIEFVLFVVSTYGWLVEQAEKFIRRFKSSVNTDIEVNQGQSPMMMHSENNARQFL